MSLAAFSEAVLSVLKERILFSEVTEIVIALLEDDEDVQVPSEYRFVQPVKTRESKNCNFIKIQADFVKSFIEKCLKV